MRSVIRKIATLFRKRSFLILVVIFLVFTAAIGALFTQEKRRLGAEFEKMITSSLNLHTRSNAAQIDRMITDAGRALQTAATMLDRFDTVESIQERLARRNANAPDYPTEYAPMEALEAGAPHIGGGDALRRLERGEMVVSISCDEAPTGACLSVLVPLTDQSGMAGALYTRLEAEELFHGTLESAVYQEAQNVLITDDGDIVFNTFAPGRSGKLLDSLSAYQLGRAEIDRIADVIRSPEVDSATFLRHGENYFVSAAPLGYNGWQLVSFVRGPDVVLRSANFFGDVVRTSVVAILITAAAACVIFLRLLLSKRRLEEEQRRNRAFIRRFQAMFEQHSAPKVVVDAATREVVDANPALLSYFGYTREEMLGRSMQEFNLLPDDIVAKGYRSELAKDAMFSAAPYRLKSGEIRLLDVYASYIMEGERKMLYAILFDVTDKEHYREELLQEKELLRTTLHSIGDGVVTTDNLGMITGMNSVAEHLTGWDAAQAVDRRFSEVFVLQNEDTGQAVENPIQKVLETGLVIGLANHTELVDLGGARTPIADSAAPIRAENGQTYGVVMVFRDVSDEKAHSRQIEFLSYHDSLTGLYNRRYIEEMLARPDMADFLPVSVIMADVNGLKITNDVFGHKAGDALLKSVADLMRGCCTEGSLIARWGGDEFVVLMLKTRLESAEAAIGRMKDAHITIEGSSLSLSLSLGCACKDGPKTSIQAAMQQAEENMYQQKLLDGKSYRNAITSTLLATLYEKSNETQAHSKRIETYCHAIGRELQLSSREMDELSLLALLHDIGKVGINPSILQKPGPLSCAEWDEMKRHPEIGYRIAQATPELAVVADLILSHHERWDGAGYPRGLKGAEIPQACRILSVVDAFDAMTNDRVYRRAMSVGEALLEIERNVGKQFDPQAAKLLIAIVLSGDKSLLPQ